MKAPSHDPTPIAPHCRTPTPPTTCNGIQPRTLSTARRTAGPRTRATVRTPAVGDHSNTMQAYHRAAHTRAHTHSSTTRLQARLVHPVVSRQRRISPWRPAATRVPSAEAAVLLEAGQPYLDVRTPQEFAEGHAVGAVNIPFLVKGADGQLVPNSNFLQQVKQAFPDAEQQLVVGCRSGNRSARACALLEEQLSYSNLIDDTGGWLGWVEAKLPITQ